MTAFVQDWNSNKTFGEMYFHEGLQTAQEAHSTREWEEKFTKYIDRMSSDLWAVSGDWKRAIGSDFGRDAEGASIQGYGFSIYDVASNKKNTHTVRHGTLMEVR